MATVLTLVPGSKPVLPTCELSQSHHTTQLAHHVSSGRRQTPYEDYRSPRFVRHCTRCRATSRDLHSRGRCRREVAAALHDECSPLRMKCGHVRRERRRSCLLYTSDAAD